MFTMPLSFSKPPLNLNDRMHWARKAQRSRLLRDEAAVRARSMRLPKHAPHVTITFHYQPRDNRRRDASNLIATVKPLVDGLVDYGLVVDDCAPYVTERMPVIHSAIKGEGGRCWLEIEVDK